MNIYTILVWFKNELITQLKQTARPVRQNCSTCRYLYQVINSFLRYLVSLYHRVLMSDF